MAITLKFYGGITDKLGLTGNTLKHDLDGIEEVEHLLDDLCEDIPGLEDEIYSSEEKEIRDGFLVLLNGRNIKHLEGLETAVEDGDKVVMFPPVAGG